MPAPASTAAAALPAPTAKQRLSPMARALGEGGAQGRYLVNKDAFDCGRTAQLFAGLNCEGQPAVFKRLSLLEPGPQSKASLFTR
ncbi:MAG: hypothetical protein EOO40_11085 [Deltaproteobacteria bacterium]|nr:MAG: hypothetical protein EOO40_11085 [Deltaproteobacteria bacterium]